MFPYVLRMDRAALLRRLRGGSANDPYDLVIDVASGKESDIGVIADRLRGL
jgi:hypothetical protein